MKKIICPFILIALFSCKSKEPSEADFMQRAIQSNDYKVVAANFQRVKDSLDLIKKKPIDTAAVIYEYNTIAGSSTIQATTMAQVIKEMNEMDKDTSFLKSVQTHLAAKLAKDHRDSTRNSN
jgi:hypothetical protein